MINPVKRWAVFRRGGIELDCKDWLLLKTLAETGSITRAAVLLFVSQPALSKRIRSLEDEFNTPLLIRNSSGITFTKAGSCLVRYSKEMLQQYQQVKNSIEELKNDEEQYAVRIGVPNMFSQFQLPPLLKNFLLRYPKINPTIRSGFTTEISQWMRQGEIQIAFLRGENIDDEYERYLVSQDPICLISRVPMDLESLPHGLRIIYDTDPSLHDNVNTWWSLYFGERPYQVGMRVGDSQTCIRMVRQGVGYYALIPRYVISEQDRPVLHVQPLYDREGRKILRSTWLVCRKSELQFRAVRAFVDFIKGQFAPVRDPFAQNI